ncbi:MAG: hypothetical protein Q9222_006771 [Ikaeria aurantiellina]
MASTQHTSSAVASSYGDGALDFIKSPSAEMATGDTLEPVWGPFRLPRAVGIFVNILACAYLILILFFSFWPPAVSPTAATMNYSVLMTGAVVIFSVIYYLLHARSFYVGPVIEDINKEITIPLSLQLVNSNAEFHAVIDCEWEAYENPHNPAWKFFYPIWGNDASSRAAAIQESLDRQIKLHHSRASVSNWIKVVDEDTGEVAGAALWLVFEENPYAEWPKEKPTCTWWPEGPKRAMADEIMGQVMVPRLERMSKPHLLIDLCFVRPSYRRRGVGKMLVEWGTKKADDMGIESFVESTLSGKPLYESCGYVSTDAFELNPTPPEDTPELRKLQQDLIFTGYFMWRPVGGGFVEGKTVIPWKETSA